MTEQKAEIRPESPVVTYEVPKRWLATVSDIGKNIEAHDVFMDLHECGIKAIGHHFKTGTIFMAWLTPDKPIKILPEEPFKMEVQTSYGTIRYMLQGSPIDTTISVNAQQWLDEDGSSAVKMSMIHGIENDPRPRQPQMFKHKTDSMPLRREINRRVAHSKLENRMTMTVDPRVMKAEIVQAVSVDDVGFIRLEKDGMVISTYSHDEAYNGFIPTTNRRHVAISYDETQGKFALKTEPDERKKPYGDKVMGYCISDIAEAVKRWPKIDMNVRIEPNKVMEIYGGDPLEGMSLSLLLKPIPVREADYYIIRDSDKKDYEQDEMIYQYR